MTRLARLVPLLLMIAACATAPQPTTDMPEGSAPTSQLAAGFRYSVYGPDYNPGPEYWGDVGRQMAERFPGAVPGAVWIVGRLAGQGTELSFPGSSADPLIKFTEEDGNEEVLTLFDELGFECWLQVEPGNAPVDELIDLMLDRYGHHPCVTGVGVDVEWYRSVEEPDGEAVSDEVAARWLAAAREHDPSYRLFLKHWLVEKMPPTLRDGLVFIDDSQIFPSMDAMVNEFAEWGKTFAPSAVGFQYGYPSDRPWWRELSDPAKEIGDRILEVAPNTEGLYWVDFTVLEVFPPPPEIAAAHAVRPSDLVKDPIVGMKIYERPEDVDATFARWRELGVTTAFVSETLGGDEGFRRMAKDDGVDVFVIAPVFHNPEAIAAQPDLMAVTADGKPAKEEWLEFACPSRESYRAARVSEIRGMVERLRPQGLSIDFIRHFVFWERVVPATLHGDIPNSCFCASCVTKFSEKTGLAVPEGVVGTPEVAAWILANHAAAWTEWKIDLVDSMAAEIVAAARAVDPEIKVNIHAVPWRRTDFGGAILRNAGQDFARLSKHADYLSPMCYAHMVERSADWIHSVVVRLEEEASAPILPSIQAREAYRPDTPFSDVEFEQHLREALRLPSLGVVFWSWEAFEHDQPKLDVARNVLDEARRGRDDRDAATPD